MSEIKFDLSKLNDKNYSSWEFKVRIYIEREGLLSFIDEEPPAEKSVDWKKNDAIARSMILFSIEDSQLSHCKKSKNAYEMWNALKSHHQKSSLFTTVILFKKICRTNFVDGQNMKKHVGKMTDLFEKLIVSGEIVSDNLMIAFLLSSLPESYDSVVMSLETRTDDNLTAKIVKDRIIDEYERRKSQQSDFGNTSHEKVFKINKNQKFCSFCKKSGHVYSECFHVNSKNNSNKRFFNKNKNSAKETVKKVEEKEFLFCTEKSTCNEWIIDSACSSHMCSNKIFFRIY